MARQYQQRPNIPRREEDTSGYDPDWQPGSTNSIRPSDDILSSIDDALAESEKVRDQSQALLEDEAASDELDALNERVGEEADDQDEEAENFYRDEGTNKPKSFRARFVNPRNTIIVTAGVLIGAGGIGMISLTPGFLITHLRDMLLNKVSAMQIYHQRRYRRSKLHKMADMFTLEGRRGGKIIADMELRGYRFAFDPNNRNRIIGITPPRSNQSITGTGIADHLEEYLEVRHPLRTSRWKTKRMEAFYGRYGVTRGSPVRIRPNDLDSPDKTVNRNVAGSVLENNYDPTIEGLETIPDNATSEERAAIEARNASRLETAQNNGMFGDVKRELLAGENLEDIEGDIARITPDVNFGIGDDLFDVANNTNGVSVGGVVKSFGTFDVADKICTVKNRLRTAVTAARNYRALALLKYAGVFIGAGDDIRTGKGDSKLIGSLMKRITATDRNGQSIGASPGFAYIAKGAFSRSRNHDAKAGYGVDGKLGGTFEGIQTATDAIPGTGKTACGVYQNPFVQIGAAVGEVVIGIFTGGSSAAVSDATKRTVKQIVKEALERVVTRSVIKSTAKAVARGVLVELSFEGVMALTQMYAEKSMTLTFTGQEKGGELGGILAAGAGVMSKQRNLQAGQVPATTEQYAQAQSEYVAYRASELSKQSVFARVFDVNNYESLAFNLAVSMPTSYSQMAVSLVNSFTKLPSTLTSGFGKIFGLLLGGPGARAYAASEDLIPFEEYVTEGDNSGIRLATDPAGNMLTIMPDDIAAIDPDENIEALIAAGHIDPTSLEPLSKTFKHHVANCVEAIDLFTRIEWEDQSKPENDCLATQPLTKSFKAHLAYLDMVDGIDAELFPEEIISQAPSSPTLNRLAYGGIAL